MSAKAGDEPASSPEVAVIMCGGRGSRLGPLGEVVHKALLPVAGAPFVEHALREAAFAGVREAWVVVGHLGSQLEHFIGDGSRFGLSVRFRRSMSGGTCGALAGLAGQVRGHILYSHANVYCPQRSALWLAAQHSQLGHRATFACSAYPEAPTHPRFDLDALEVRRVRHEGPGPYSIGRAIIDASLIEGLDAESEETVEDGICGVADQVAAVEYPWAWCHLEALSFYRDIGAAVDVPGARG